MNPWYRDGLRFTCTQCGDCCRTHGDYHWVFLDSDDVTRLAAHHGVTNTEFLHAYCDKDEDGLGHTLKWPNDGCVFLERASAASAKPNETGCSVYEARPQQCRTWPFWPENLRKKTWEEEVVPFCPGAGEGRLYTLAELRRISKNETETNSAAEKK